MKSIIKSLLLTFLLTTLSFITFAQRGNVTGLILDAETKEPIIGATVLSTTSNGGGFSDDEGKFSANFTVGVQVIKIEYIGSASKEIENVNVTDGVTTDIGTVLIESKVKEAIKGGVVVRVKRSTTSETAVLAEMKNAVNLVDVTGSQAMSKAGDGNVAAAAQRVTGVSIEGGKYIFVRGLGDRYTKTVLNGMELPGLDPDRNTLQMDIFPTNLIDNIMVVKSFTPNLSGDFTGGWIDVKTKDFQAREVFEISGSIGYNPAMNLNSNYLTYSSSAADGFGLGASSRKLPIAEELVPASLWATKGAEAQRLVEKFDKTMATERKTSLLNSSFALSYGNQKDNKGATLGYNLAFGYSNEYNYYDKAIYETYLKSSNTSENELKLASINNGSLGENEVLWSALANGSYKKGKNSFSTTLFHTQNGIKKSSLLDFENIDNPFGDAGAKLEKSVLYYNQRMLTSLLLKHTYGDSDTTWKITSKLSPSIASNNEPDMRITALSPDENGYRFNVGAGSEVARIYRSLQEYALNAKVDAEKSFELKNKAKTKVLFGAANSIKSRAFGVVKYTFQAPSYASMNFSGDPNQIFEEYLFNDATDEGFFVSGGPVKANFFDAWMNVAGVYAMNEMPLMYERINLIYGVRVEKADMYYTGSNTQNVSYTNEKVLDELNVLPSVNVMYKITPKVNLRLAGTRTLARPSFKEKSLAQIIDPVSGRTFIGNLDLQQTEVTNFDVRYEWYMNRGELFSFGAFYKDFTNPIEIVVYKPETPTNFTPRNATSANVYGLEMELKKSLEPLSKSLENYFVATNVSYIISEVTMTPQEILGKTNELRDGQSLGTTREMQGQAPYIINGSLNYDGKENGINANVSYNVQGPKLAIVGIGRVADVYTEPFHSLNTKISFTLGEKKNMKASIAATNILADDNLQVYRSYNAQDQIFTQLLPQRTFKLGFTYTIK
jgi:TonB-dependent receptor